MADDTGWEKLGAHQGIIMALLWTPDGKCLFSASYDGEVRNWRNGSYQTVRSAVDPDESVSDLAWSTSQSCLIASINGKLVVYKNGAGEGVALPGPRSAVTLRCDSTGDYLALREMKYFDELKQVRPRLEIWPTDASAELPLLDSDIFTRGESWHYDFLWHPKNPFLAVLADSEISFASPLTRRFFGNNSWVGPYPNAIAWISDDELAVACGDANVRIFSGNETDPSISPLKKTAVLEAHEKPVDMIATGLGGNIFISVDTDRHFHVWSAKGQHLAEFLAPQDEVNGMGAILAIHPNLPVIALSRANVVYQRMLNISLDAMEAPQVQQEPEEDLMLSLLRRAGLSPPEKLTSDDALKQWGIHIWCETASDRLACTLEFRRIARLVGQLCLKAAEAIGLVWKELSHNEKMVFENLHLGEADANGELSKMARVRNQIREGLESILSSESEMKRNLSLCAYTALGYVEQVAYTQLFNSQAYGHALDQLKEDDLRPKLKTYRNRGANLKTAGSTSALLDEINVTLARMLEHVEGQEHNGKTALKDASKRSGSDVQDIIVVAAPQELATVRSYLNELGLALEEHVLGNRRLDTFQLLTNRRGNVAVGVMFPLAKGKTEMKSLLEAVKAQSGVQHVVMVGMMAGIKGKSRLLDVLAPLTIYDVTSIGTKDGKFVVEPEAGTMDPIMHNWTAGMDPRQFGDPRIRLIGHKKTVTFSAKIDDLTHDLAEAGLNVDPENVVGLEMEGSALIEMQTRDFGRRRIGYLMIKGVADYAGARPDEAEVKELEEIPGLKEALSNPDPTNSIELKTALQHEATRRSLRVALELLRRLPAT